MTKNVGENMPATFTYQMSGCVLITPRYVPGILLSPEIVEAAGGKHAQYFDTTEIELASYYYSDTSSFVLP